MKSLLSKTGAVAAFLLALMVQFLPPAYAVTCSLSEQKVVDPDGTERCVPKGSDPV